MAVDHYENFPVASILLPRHLRHAVEVIYNFARQADDFADEGNATDTQRLSSIYEFRAELNLIAEDKTPRTGLFRDLAEVIHQHQLPQQLFHDLLDAFSQDVIKKTYDNFSELQNYCGRSANPIGALLLHLYGAATPQNLAYSNAICSALQLINFWQDVEKDFAIGRIYLPQDDMTRFHVSISHIAKQRVDAAWQQLMQFQVQRARDMMSSGAPLGNILTGRIGLEMRMIIAGGNRILDKLEAAQYDMYRKRPVLRPLDWLSMIYTAALRKT